MPRRRARGAQRPPPGTRFGTPPTSPVRLSVVMPVYNERETVASVIEDVLGVELDGVDLELVIVESNSTDGSRDIVRKFEDDPRVEVVLQDVARGKGAAVRAGFEQVTGDIVLIQDGDREYEVADYPNLLAPIQAGDADFVLGSRHVEGQPLREMPGSRALNTVINVAHHVLLAMFNLTYRTHLRDPFTMYKVFRRECIDGVEFVSDRFDFDWEIVAKLKRLGYEPWEVPVSYQARSFAGGKKVRFFRDPPTWVAACIRFRFSRIRRST